MNRYISITFVFFILSLQFLYPQGSVPQGPGFLVEPYILEVSPESATVAFHLKQPSAAKVRVWVKDKIIEYDSPSNSTAHFIKITGLKSGKNYFYQVLCNTPKVKTKEKDMRYQIRTSGKQGESFTFAVYGDARPGDIGTSYYHKAVIAQASLHEPQFCLVLGDMVDDGTKPKLWEDFFRIESPVISKSAIYPVLGDNDFENGNGIYEQYFPMLSKGYYHFSWNGVQFFALNTWDTRGGQPHNELDRESKQVKWFTEEMQKEEIKNAPYRIVFMHDPAYISRGRASEILLSQWVPMFQKYNIDIVFASWHLYERLQHKGVTYIISGGAGAEIIWMPENPAYPSQSEARRHHFCRVDVNSSSLIIRAIADDGTVLDNFTLSPKSISPVPKRREKRLVNELNKQQGFNYGTKKSPLLPVYLFSYDCNFCKKIQKVLLPGMAKKHKLNIQLNYFDLSRRGTYELFLNAGAEFGRQNADIPAIFIGNRVLGGEKEITKLLEKELILFRKNPIPYSKQAITPFQQQVNTSIARKDAFNSLTLGIIISAGLLDGINPCAFTTIIFLISYLSLVGITRKKVIYNGILYIIAVFITYFAIGITFFSFAKILLNNKPLSVIINLPILILVIILGVLSILDYLRCKKGKSSEIILQLPDKIKRRIRSRVRDFARKNVALAGASFALGVVIAGMELTCTGQVYIPIVTLISDPVHRLQAVFYLFCYNIAFIIPLALVFIITAFGISSEKIKTIFERNMASIKLSFAIMFALMALLIIYNIQWIF